jgi:hypothetical protein
MVFFKLSEKNKNEMAMARRNKPNQTGKKVHYFIFIYGLHLQWLDLSSPK